MKQWFVFTLLFVYACANPGVQLALSESTANQVLMIAYAFGLAGKEFHLGDFAYKYKSDLGDVDMKLSDITISSVTLDYVNSIFSFQSPNKVTYSLKSLQVQGKAGYDIKVGLFALTPGNATFSLGSSNATVTLTLTETAGRPQISISESDYSLNLGDVAIKTALPDVFNALIEKEIHDQIDTIQKEIPSLLSKYIPMINAKLSSLDTVITCPVKPLAVDIGLISSPSVQNSYLVCGLNGTIIAEGEAIPGGTISPVVVGADISEGVQIAVTDYVINSLLLPLTAEYSYTVTSLPASVGIALDTTGLAILFPELRQKFGAGRHVRVTAFSGEGDHVSYWTKQALNLNGSSSLLFEVYSQSNWQNAATLDFNVQLTANVSVSNNVASAYVSSLTIPSITTIQSSIGSINTLKMTTLLNILIKTILLEINPELSSIPLPIPKEIAAYLTTDDLKVGNGYVVLGVDI